MFDQNTPGENLKFPLDCHIRVVALKHATMRELLEKALQDLGVQTRLEEGNESAGGKYISFHFDVRIETLDFMKRIDADLRQVEGVIMVL